MPSLSKLLGGSLSLSSHQPSDTPAALQEFHVRAAPHNSKLKAVHPAGYPETAPPLYTVAFPESSKPNVVLYRGDASPYNTIGDASVSILSSTIKLNLRGQPLALKASSSGSGKFTIQSHYGTLRWIPSEISSSYTLKNEAGHKIAQYKSDGWTGNKRLSLFVTSDAYFVEMLLLSILAGKLQNSSALEVASEVAGAAAGV
ncbi:hypothetical protein B0I35DRAFT_439067 [Stachybotrys elegans]|uniref:Uncharacterized protein n=1 Tax=Stachybotrys elegans TaxID=80388 RepID=A0A8K0SPB5_9HYPO|nr:hypothetical protein B0I35DRAFT_439067 [Stachybotrys elegans]